MTNAQAEIKTQADYEAPIACGWNKSAIEQVADQFASALEFTYNDDIEPVVERLGGKIEYEGFSLENTMLAGWIEVDGVKNFRIRLNNETNSLRDRFTIAHELGHYVLHYLFALGARGAFKLSANLTTHNQPTDPNPENEANFFALSFLMPKSDFQDYYNSVCKLNQEPLELTATKFSVPLWAVEIRARSLQLIN